METHALFRTVITVLMPVLLILSGSLSHEVAGQSVPLGIFGNANEDGSIDMRDITSIERMILGITPVNRFADAGQNGRVDKSDLDLAELIICEKERSITFEDERKKAVTFTRPIKRVIPEHITSLAAMRIINAEKLMVSIGSTAVTDSMGPAFLQGLSGLPTIGTYGQPDYEAILNLNPDLLIAYRCQTLQEKLPGVMVYYAGYGEPYPPGHFEADMRRLGYLLDRREQAERFIRWHNRYLDMVTKRTSVLSEDEKPRVYTFYPLLGFYMCRGNYPPVRLAGGVSVGESLGPGFAVSVDPEWVIEQNPDVIIGATIPDRGAYETDDLSGLVAQRNQVLNRPELARVTAVKKKSVYFQNNYALGLFPNFILSVVYYAKWFHPDLFKDLDPRAVHQEYLDKFQKIDFQVSEHGIFVYPSPQPAADNAPVLKKTQMNKGKGQ